MELLKHIKARRWPTVLGYLLFVGMMAGGYYYSLTFIQLGLVDLGKRVIGLENSQTAVYLAFLAVAACATALLAGWWMQRQGWGREFRVKLRLIFAVICAQTVQTAIIPLIRQPQDFLAWIFLTGLTLGIAVPASFSLTVDLIPTQDRGIVGGLITAGAYFAAETFSRQWTIDEFRADTLWLMIAGGVIVGGLAFGRFGWLEQLAHQHRRAEFGHGRYVQVGPDGRSRVRRRLLALIVVMFAIYFVDSLGFLRLLDTPIYMDNAWQSPQLGTRLFIALTHVAAALVAGALYHHLSERSLFLWVFAIFAVVHLLYILDYRSTRGAAPSLAMPLLYAAAVSVYTVINFAVWADISTPSTISFNTALGVALSAWTATFLSTALAIRLQDIGVTLEMHLRLVNALAVFFFMGGIAVSLIPEASLPRPPIDPAERRPGHGNP